MSHKPTASTAATKRMLHCNECFATIPYAFLPNFFVLIALLSQFGLAQTPVPYEAYTLHAKEERRNGFSISEQIALLGSAVLLDHQHNLLVLISQADWRVSPKRLRGWETKAPTEDTLEITGEPGQVTKGLIDTD